MSSQWGLAVCWQWDRGAGTGIKNKVTFPKKQPGDEIGCMAHAQVVLRDADGSIKHQVSSAPRHAVPFCESV